MEKTTPKAVFATREMSPHPTNPSSRPREKQGVAKQQFGSANLDPVSPTTRRPSSTTRNSARGADVVSGQRKYGRFSKEERKNREFEEAGISWPRSSIRDGKKNERGYSPSDVGARIGDKQGVSRLGGADGGRRYEALLRQHRDSRSSRTLPLLRTANTHETEQAQHQMSKPNQSFPGGNEVGSVTSWPRRRSAETRTAGSHPHQAITTGATKKKVLPPRTIVVPQEGIAHSRLDQPRGRSSRSSTTNTGKGRKVDTAQQRRYDRFSKEERKKREISRSERSGPSSSLSEERKNGERNSHDQHRTCAASTKLNEENSRSVDGARSANGEKLGLGYETFGGTTQSRRHNNERSPQADTKTPTEDKMASTSVHHVTFESGKLRGSPTSCEGKPHRTSPLLPIQENEETQHHIARSREEFPGGSATSSFSPSSSSDETGNAARQVAFDSIAMTTFPPKSATMPRDRSAHRTILSRPDLPKDRPAHPLTHPRSDAPGYPTRHGTVSFIPGRPPPHPATSDGKVDSKAEQFMKKSREFEHDTISTLSSSVAENNVKQEGILHLPPRNNRASSQRNRYLLSADGAHDVNTEKHMVGKDAFGVANGSTCESMESRLHYNERFSPVDTQFDPLIVDKKEASSVPKDFVPTNRTNPSRSDEREAIATMVWTRERKEGNVPENRCQSCGCCCQ